MSVHAISQQDLKFSFLHNVYTHTLFAVFCMHMHVRITVVPRGVPYKSYLHSTAKYLSIPSWSSYRIVLVVVVDRSILCVRELQCRTI